MQVVADKTYARLEGAKRLQPQDRSPVRQIKRKKYQIKRQNDKIGIKLQAK